MAWIAAAAAIGSAVLGNQSSEKAAGQAGAGSQQAGALNMQGMQQALAMQQGMFDFGVSAGTPYATAGLGGLGAITGMLGMAPPQADAHDYNADIAGQQKKLEKLQAQRKKYNDWQKKGIKLGGSDLAQWKKVNSQIEEVKTKMQASQKGLEQQTMQQRALQQYASFQSPFSFGQQPSAPPPTAGAPMGIGQFMENQAGAGQSIGQPAAPTTSATSPISTPPPTPVSAGQSMANYFTAGNAQAASPVNGLAAGTPQAMALAPSTAPVSPVPPISPMAQTVAPIAATPPAPSAPTTLASMAPSYEGPSYQASTQAPAGPIQMNKPFAFDFDESQLENTSAYKFRMNQSLEALDRRLAAGGMRGSGNRYAGILEMASGIASQEYEAEYGRQYASARDAYSSKFDVYNLFANMAGMGAVQVQNQASNAMSAGSNMANIIQTGYGGAANAAMGMGTAAASGTMGQNNASQNMLSQLINIGGQAGWFDKDK